MSLNCLDEEYHEVFGSSADALKIRKIIKEKVFDLVEKTECQHAIIKPRFGSKMGGICQECGVILKNFKDKTTIIKDCNHLNQYEVENGVLMCKDCCVQIKECPHGNMCELKNGTVICRNQCSEICKHLGGGEKAENGLYICKDCFAEFEIFDFCPEWNYFGHSDNRTNKDPSRCHYSGSSNKSLDEVFSKYKFSVPNAVRDLTQQKYDVIIKRLKSTGEKSTVRNKKKLAIVAACLFYAFKEFGEHRTSGYIKNGFTGLEQKHISAGLTEYSKSFPDDRDSVTTAENLIKWHMTLVGIHISHYRNILKICKYLENSSQSLKRSNPQSVSAAIIYFYLCLKSDYKTQLGMTKTKFASRVELSDITITKLVREVSRVSQHDVQI